MYRINKNTVSLSLSSFYGRIENSIGCLPRFYYHTKPHIAFVESDTRVFHHGAPKVSYNWIIGSDIVERIESKSGKLVGSNGKIGISRLSKRSFFQEFLKIKEKLPDINYSDGDEKMTYAREKELASDFQVCKRAVHFYEFQLRLLLR